LDEDTSATNLLYKDDLMKKLIPEDPIRPLSEIIGHLYEKHKISFTAITTASSTFLPVSTLILKMKYYQPLKIESPVEARRESAGVLRDLPGERVFLGVDRLKRIKYSNTRILVEYEGRGFLEYTMAKNPRVIEESRIRFIAAALRRIVKTWPGKRMSEISRLVTMNLDLHGFEYYTNPVPPDMAESSGLDVVWVLNRLYGLRVRRKR
jgi:hypothetical protein